MFQLKLKFENHKNSRVFKNHFQKFSIAWNLFNPFESSQLFQFSTGKKSVPGAIFSRSKADPAEAVSK